MGIPKPVRPEYSATIPSSGKRIKYQPFSVKEEKVLILAAESKDLDEITNAIHNVIKSCVTTAGFDPNDLALFDVEYLFLRCRAKSIGESISVKITDPSDPSYTVDHKILIDKIQVHKEKSHKDVIELDDKLSIKMRYPDISFFNNGIDISDVAAGVSTISRCISQIVVDGEEYNREDMTNKELEEWIEGLTQAQFTKLRVFFETMPRLQHKITLKNKNTGNDFTVVLEGLSDFF